MGTALQDNTVVVVGRGSGIARAVALLAHHEGARVIVAGRDKAKLADAYAGLPITAESVDITDDATIGALPTALVPSIMWCRRRRPAPGGSSPTSIARICRYRSTPR
jgi:NADP-dependent 3-hydroxy acid dehydrogenase YdfG